MIVKFSFIIFFCMAASHFSFGQNQHNQWYFGFGAGLDFNSGSPVALSDNVITTDEGVASISDINGNLLFYTNGEVVQNKMHQQMPNGFAIGGHFSSSQSALIVPVPKEDSLYYIFTVPAEINYTSGNFAGLSYSIIDMRLNNTLGDVVVKNIPLVDSVVEKLTAIRHKNGRDVWVVVHKWNSSAFYSYLVSCDGIHSPVVSFAGRPYNQDINGSATSALGCMKISPRGDKIASTWRELTVLWETFSCLDILDFDNETGEISNAISVTHQQTGSDISGYGVCFSPSGSKLYLSEFGLLSGIGFGRVLQYDIDAADIEASEQTVVTDFQAYGSMQIAPDGMIYLARLNGAQYISRIQFPDNAASACGFDNPGVPIGGAISTWGLPNNWDEFPAEEQYEIFSFTDTTVCQPLVKLDATYRYTDSSPAYLWSTGSVAPIVYITQPGTYWVKIIMACDTISDSINVHMSNPQVWLGNDTTICKDENIVLSAGGTGVSYEWNTGSTAALINVSAEGMYWVKILDSLGCPASDTIFIDERNCMCEVTIPNVFTPNNDSKNETFRPLFVCDLISYDFSIYNRWGEKVFHSLDPQDVWKGFFKGTAVPPAVYYWVLNYSWSDVSDEKKASRNGTVTIIR